LGKFREETLTRKKAVVFFTKNVVVLML